MWEKSQKCKKIIAGNSGLLILLHVSCRTWGPKSVWNSNNRFVYFQVKTTTHQWPNIPETTISQSDPAPRWTESTVMDIDHPEEFFEPWQLWRFSQGSIIALTQLWGSDLKPCFLQRQHGRLEAPGHRYRLLCNWLTHIPSTAPVWHKGHNEWMLSQLVILEYQQDVHGLQTFPQQWAGRGHLTGLMVLSEKPDQTLPKTLFWPSLIIHRVWWRSGTLPKVFFQGLLRHPCLLCPPILPRASSVHFLCPSSCSRHFLFSCAFSFCSYAGNISLQPGPSCSDERKPSPFKARLRNRSCLVHRDGLFPASVVTHSLSHAHSPCSHLPPLLLCCFVTAFAAALAFQAAQGVCLCGYYANLIRLEGITAVCHQKEEAQFEHLTNLKLSWSLVVLEDLWGFWQRFISLQWKAHSQNGFGSYWP